MLEQSEQAENIRSWVQRGNDASECGPYRPRGPFGFLTQ